jgi:heme-degrading monooxygenase HmoA
MALTTGARRSWCATDGALVATPNAPYNASEDSYRAAIEFQQEDVRMFIAMNRFQVKPGSEQAFETLWAKRESYLGNTPGFIEFHLVKGPAADDHTLYASHTVWADRGSFESWTKSEAFRRAHARADNKTGESLYLGHPKFEGFEVLQTERKAGA